MLMLNVYSNFKFQSILAGWVNYNYPNAFNFYNMCEAYNNTAPHNYYDDYNPKEE